MPTNRAFLLACATVATLGLSAATPADARPCREGSCSARSAIAGAMQAAMAKQMQAAMAKKMQAAMVAKQAEMEKKAKAEMAAKQAEMGKRTSNAAAGGSMVPTENPMALQNDFDVVEDGVIVGRIFFLDAFGPQGRPWMWASVTGDIRRAASGYEPTREAAMAAFAKSWRGDSR